MQNSLGHDTVAIYRDLLCTSIPFRHSYPRRQLKRALHREVSRIAGKRNEERNARQLRKVRKSARILATLLVGVFFYYFILATLHENDGNSIDPGQIEQLNGVQKYFLQTDARAIRTLAAFFFSGSSLSLQFLLALFTHSTHRTYIHTYAHTRDDHNTRDSVFFFFFFLHQHFRRLSQHQTIPATK